MINLQNIFDGFFSEERITHERLHNFAIDNVKRMTINNPGGIYARNILDTQGKADTLKGKITGKSTDSGTKIGATSAKDWQRDAIEKYIAVQMPGAIAAFGGKNQPGFQATYPNLMNSFYNVSKADFATNTEALIAKAGTYVAVLGVPFKTTITNMYALYEAADDTQVADVAAVGSDIVYEDLAAQALADQLSDNVGDIARNNRRSTTALSLYFTEKLLFPAQIKQIKKGKPAANSTTDICKIEYTAGKRTHIHNKGATKLIFGMKLLGVKVGAVIGLLPDEKANEAFSYYFSNGDTLYVENPDSTEGLFQMEIIS